MDDHTIRVTVNRRSFGVRAESNPLSGVQPGETVAWVFDAAEKDLRVVFKRFEPADGSEILEPVDPRGPFESLTASEGRISGTISKALSERDRGRFIYDVFAGETKLGWSNPLPDGGNFGGLDIPPPPPRIG